MERPNEMTVKEFLHIHSNESADVARLINEYNTLVLFSIHQECNKKIQEIKESVNDNSVITNTEYHLVDLETRILNKLN